MLEVPSVNAIYFLIMCCLVFELLVLDAPATIAHDFLLCSRLEVRVEWFFSLVESPLVAKS